MIQRDIGQSSTNRMSNSQNQYPIGHIHFQTKLVTIKTFTPHASHYHFRTNNDIGKGLQSQIHY